VLLNRCFFGPLATICLLLENLDYVKNSELKLTNYQLLDYSTVRKPYKLLNYI